MSLLLVKCQLLHQKHFAGNYDPSVELEILENVGLDGLFLHEDTLKVHELKIHENTMLESLEYKVILCMMKAINFNTLIIRQQFLKRIAWEQKKERCNICEVLISHEI